MVYNIFYVCVNQVYSIVNIYRCVDRFGLMEWCWSGDFDQWFFYLDILQILITLLIYSDINIVLDDFFFLYFLESEVDSEYNLQLC